MRIGIDTLFENPSNPSNAVSFLIGLVEHLSEVGRDHEFFVFVSPTNRSLFGDRPRSNVHFVLGGSSNESISRRLLSQQFLQPILAHRLRLDVFHSPGNVLPLAVRCKSVVKICTMHHYRFADSLGAARTLYRRWSIAASARKADVVIANSASTRADILKYLKVSDERIVTVHEALDPIFLRPASSDEERGRTLERYELRRGFFLYVSALWMYKNPETLMRAYAALIRRYQIEQELVFAGSGPAPYVLSLKRLASELGIAERTRFLGYVPHEELIHLYAAADVFVYPSLSETFGHPPLQAMARATPVVASNSTSIPEVVGDAALLVDPTDVDALADAIFRAATDPSLRSRLIANGLARIHSFSWSRTATETLEALTSVVAAG